MAFWGVFITEIAELHNENEVHFTLDPTWSLVMHCRREFFWVCFISSWQWVEMPYKPNNYIIKYNNMRTITSWFDKCYQLHGSRFPFTFMAWRPVGASQVLYHECCCVGAQRRCSRSSMNSSHSTTSVRDYIRGHDMECDVERLEGGDLVETW